MPNPNLFKRIYDAQWIPPRIYHEPYRTLFVGTFLATLFIFALSYPSTPLGLTTRKVFKKDRATLYEISKRYCNTKLTFLMTYFI